MTRKKWTKKQRTEHREQQRTKVQKMMASFDDTMSGFMDAVDEAAASDELHKFLNFVGQFHQYSFRNAMLIMAQNPEATRVAGFRTWKKLGRHVKKGEHGLMILRPQMNKRDATPGEVADKTVETIDGKVRWLSFKPAYVFDVSQTDGDGLPELNYSAKGDEDNGLLDDLLQAAENGGVAVEFATRAEMNGADGLSHNDHRVQVNKDKPRAAQAAILAHELAHDILHQNGEQRPSRPTRELEAEAVAYAVCAARGVEHQGAAKYVAWWRGLDADDARRALEESMGRVRDATARLLGGNGPDGDAD